MKRTQAMWENLRFSLDEEARELKDSQWVHSRLSSEYQRLKEDERLVVDRILAEWIRSPDEAKRFDAIALIAEHSIVSAIPALLEALPVLDRARDPSAGFEAAKIQRVLRSLTRSSATSARS